MLWPDTCRRDPAGALEIGGVALPALAREFGTPLVIYDRLTLETQARRFRKAFSDAYPKSRVVYAAKALMSLAIIQILADEGLAIDVVSGGELHAALAAGIDPSRITFHGNNKSVQEVREAVEAGVGLIALDNIPEIAIVSRVATDAGAAVDCLLRLNPGIDTHTHNKIRTGQLDSKFGVPISTADAENAVAEAMRAPGVNLRGFHAHIGSQLFESDAYAMALESLAGFAARMRDEFGIVTDILCPGGGFGIAYEPDQSEASVEAWATQSVAALRAALERYDLPEPELVVEPGRSMVGRAGVTLYEVGTIKPIEGVRTFVSVDGGMSDNIRPSLYGAVYDIELAGRRGDGEEATVTIAGKYCESGDILIQEATLPPVHAGDLVALPATGAYSLAMASNYNMATRPAVVLVENGAATLIRRRETYDELLRNEVPLREAAGARS